MECTENDSTETVNIAAEKPPSDSVADNVVANLSFSPPCRPTSTQLNAVTTAKHGGKTKGRGKNTPGLSVSRDVNIKGKNLMIWYSATCARCGFITHAENYRVLS